MAMRYAIDFDKNDMVCLYANPTDPPNLFGALAAKTGDLRRNMSAGGSASAVNHTRYAEDRAKLGIDFVRWNTGTTASAAINLGYNAITHDMASQPAGTYTAVVWLKLALSASNTFRLVIGQNGLPLAATPYIGYSLPWIKLTVTATTGSAGPLFIQVSKTGSTSHIVDIAGAMIVAGPTAPDWFNCGADSLLENITAYVKEPMFEAGWTESYMNVAAVGRAELLLDNNDKRFSPSYASGPYYGDLRGDLLLQVADSAYGIQWTGWVDEWKPLPGATLEKTCTLRATDARRFLAKKIPLMALTGGSPGTILAAILNSYYVPNGTTGDNWIPNGNIANDDSPAWSSLISPLSPTYFADNTPENHDAVSLIADVATALQGKFWINRYGQWMFEAGQGNDASYTFWLDEYTWMRPVYAVGKHIVNRCDVLAHPRKVSAGTPQLWELDQPFTLAAGASKSFRAFFRNTSADKIVVGGIAPFTTAFTLAAGGGVTMTLSQIAAQSVLVTFTNGAAGSRTINTATISGQRVSGLNTISVSYEDAASIGLYGTQGEALDCLYIDDSIWGEKLAKQRVQRFKDSREEFQAVTVNAAKEAAIAFGAPIGTAVRISDSHVVHDDVYAVIGVIHNIHPTNGHYVTLYVEPMYATRVEDVTL